MIDETLTAAATRPGPTNIRVVSMAIEFRGVLSKSADGATEDDDCNEEFLHRLGPSPKVLLLDC